MRRILSVIPVLVVVTCLLLTLPSGNAIAADMVGVYVGGAVGQGRIDATVPYVDGFRENHTAFKLMVGVRPISLVGAELAYLDFGHPSRITGFIPTDVSMKGAAALGILYLPVPIVDIYAKAGLARLQSTATATSVCPPGMYCIAAVTSVCPPSMDCFTVPTTARVSRTNLGFAGGVGAQFKFGSFGVRGEYERFNAAGGHPSLLSIGATWTFF